MVVSNPNRFSNFFTGKFISKVAAKYLLKILPHFTYVAALPCKTLMLVNTRLMINYKVV